MKSEQESGLARLMLLWPERREALLRAGAPAELFESYALACDAAHWWSSRPGAVAAIIAEEYREIVAELEKEIREALARPLPVQGGR